MRSIFCLSVGFLCAALSMGADAAEQRFRSAAAEMQPMAGIDLDTEAGLSWLKQQDRDYVERVQGILTAAEQVKCDAMAHVLKVAQATDVECNMVLLVTYPAKRRISFVLDKTRLSKVVYLIEPVAGPRRLN